MSICRECRFYDRFSAKAATTSQDGFCRRFPPTALIVPGGGYEAWSTVRFESVHPAVHEIDGCGEFTLKGDVR